jgi:predicted nucleic acid-binding protein
LIVLDSAAAADYLLRLEPNASWVESQLDAAQWRLHAPHLFDVEVAGSVRRLKVKGHLDDSAAADVLRDLRDLDVLRYPHSQLIDVAWELRENLTIQDGVFVALAQALRAPVVTTDLRFAGAPGLPVPILAP